MNKLTTSTQQEKPWRDSVELLRTLINASPDIICFKDGQGCWLEANQAILKLFQLEKIDYQGKTDYQLARLTHPMYRNTLLVSEISDKMAWQAQLPIRQIETIPIAAGENLIFDVIKVPIFDVQGNRQGLVILGRNITELKQVEESLRHINKQLTIKIDELDQRHQEIILLSKMSNSLQICLTIEEAYRVIVRFMKQLFPQTQGMLALLDDSATQLESVARWKENKSDEKIPKTVFAVKDCWALHQNRIYYMGNSATYPLCHHILPNSVAIYLCVPLMAQGELLGLLHIAQSHLTTEPLGESHQRLAETVADQIALALANLKLRQNLQNQSTRDPLTGLYNRRYLEETLEREFHRAQRHNQTVGVIMVDIDYFKQFNDQFGHDAGDVVLQQLGQFLNEHIRKGDIACRYGGEEFTLILPGAALEVVHTRAKVLNTKVKKLSVQHRNQDLGVITLSIGVACFPQHGSTAEDVLHAADVALYHAKAQGRDQAIVAN
ncbi:MAG: diguanylate cyclase [Thioploca sp.]|nr:diguanylate cyclase [Thioploca sp.]